MFRAIGRRLLRSTVQGYSTYPTRQSLPFLDYNELTEREITVLIGGTHRADPPRFLRGAVIPITRTTKVQNTPVFGISLSIF